MKKFIGKFIVALILVIGFSHTVLANYRLDQANKMLGDVVSASSPKKIFNAWFKYRTITEEFEYFIFELYKQSDSNGIDSMFEATHRDIIKNEEYRDTLFEIVSLMIEMEIIDKEMIELAKNKIKKSNHPSGPKYDKFTEIPEVVKFYDNKYSDKWVRVYSKSWIYIAATSDLIFSKAKRSIKLGERLKKPQLVQLGEKFYCSMGNYNDSKRLCINTHKIYLAIKSKVASDKSIKEAKLLADKQIAEKEAQIEATKQEQRAMCEKEKINKETELKMALQQQRADEEEARLQQMVEEKNRKISETMKKIGIPDCLVNEESGALGYTQDIGNTVGSSLRLRNIIMQLTNLGCTIKYNNSMIPNSKSYSIDAKNCNITLKKNDYAGIPKDITANNINFSVAHTKYKLLDIYVIDSGMIGSEKLDSELTYVLLSGLKDQQDSTK